MSRLLGQNDKIEFLTQYNYLKCFYHSHQPLLPWSPTLIQFSYTNHAEYLIHFSRADIFGQRKTSVNYEEENNNDGDDDDGDGDDDDDDDDDGDGDGDDDDDGDGDGDDDDDDGDDDDDDDDEMMMMMMMMMMR